MKKYFYIIALFLITISCAKDENRDDKVETYIDFSNIVIPRLAPAADGKTRSFNNGEGEDYTIKKLQLFCSQIPSAGHCINIDASKCKFVGVKDNNDVWSCRIDNKNSVFREGQRYTLYFLANQTKDFKPASYSNVDDYWYNMLDILGSHDKGIDFPSYVGFSGSGVDGQNKDYFYSADEMSSANKHLPVLMYGQITATVKVDPKDPRRLYFDEQVVLTRVFAKVTIKFRMADNVELTDFNIYNVPHNMYLHPYFAEDNTLKYPKADSKLTAFYFFDNLHWENTYTKEQLNSKYNFGINSTDYVTVAEFYLPESYPDSPDRNTFFYIAMKDKPDGVNWAWDRIPLCNIKKKNSDGTYTREKKICNVVRNHHYTALFSFGIKSQLDLEIYDSTDHFEEKSGEITFE